MSKLIDKLNGLNKNSLPAMGFRRPDCEEKRLSMLVITELSGRTESEIKELAGCGIAGGIVDSAGLNAAALAKLLKNVNGIPVGLSFQGSKTGNGYKLISPDLDFVVFNVNLPLLAFEGKLIEQTGKILNIDIDMEADLLRSVRNVYPGIDAVMIDLRITTLNMENMLKCRRASDFSGQHIIALINKPLSKPELLALRDAGVKALMMPKDATVEDTQLLIDMIASLPRQEKKQDKKMVALLPKLGLSPAQKEDDDSDDDSD
ncbi:MAG: hypothetical protein JXA01_08945 [Dehalococcoidia bacterium]|nr:hypothetical protein [Dehalococcoidia bacterium]